MQLAEQKKKQRIKKKMNKIIQLIIALIVGAILWYAATLALAAIKAPAIVGTLVLILFLLALAVFIWQLFGGGKAVMVLFSPLLLNSCVAPQEPPIDQETKRVFLREMQTNQ